MDILPRYRHADPDPGQPDENELARLRSQVSWLQAERTALWWAVGHDELTGLANRRLFYALAPVLLREAGLGAVVVVLDLNGFKPINDRYGHDAGDRVLCAVAERLSSCAGNNLVARLGGDEFAAVLVSPQVHVNPYAHPDCSWWQGAVGALSAAIAEPMPVAGQTLTVTASIGVAPAFRDAPVGELVNRADLAMYQAKVTGRAGVVWEADDSVAALPAVVRPGIASRVIELALYPAAQHGGGDSVSVPTCDPILRDAADVAPAGSYQPDDPVWVHRDGAWRPGVVDGASARAVLATYRCAAGQGTVVDTMSAEFVVPRAHWDPQLDRVTSDPGVAA